MSNELTPYQKKALTETHVLIKNSEELTEAWLKELKQNKKFGLKNEPNSENAKDFLKQILGALEKHTLPKITKEEISFLKKIINSLKAQCLGKDCDLQDVTTYLLTLKTAFVKFLQKYYQGKKFEIHEEFQEFANVLDLLGFFAVEDYSTAKEAEIKELKKARGLADIQKRIIGNSQAMAEVFKKVQAVLDNDVTVLIQGETGTGKELIAQAIHYLGERKSKPFIAVNCAAIPETLLESELFGYEKGAFTGADNQKLGKFEIAHGGTLFLDEIGDLSLSMQVKLLRVLQSKQIVHLGGHDYIDVDVRIITATNKNLLAEIKEKHFREDLYYRISVFPINLPPLRERKEDIILLAEYFLAQENKKNINGFSIEAKNALKNYSWPGNIRELENVIKRATVICQNKQITPQDLLFVSLLSQPTYVKESSAKLTLAELEKKEIQARLESFQGNISKTAESLGITRATLYKKLK